VALGVIAARLTHARSMPCLFQFPLEASVAIRPFLLKLLDVLVEHFLVVDVRCYLAPEPHHLCEEQGH
jgi:hypothetical protein